MHALWDNQQTAEVMFVLGVMLGQTGQVLEVTGAPGDSCMS